MGRRDVVAPADTHALYKPRGNRGSGVTLTFKKRLELLFRKQILRDGRFRDRLHIGLNRCLHVGRLLRGDCAGPHQFVLGDVVERGLRGVFVVTVGAG